jgi:hypothetical protein
MCTKSDLFGDIIFLSCTVTGILIIIELLINNYNLLIILTEKFELFYMNHGSLCLLVYLSCLSFCVTPTLETRY